jgi:hypothetical protein
MAGAGKAIRMVQWTWRMTHPVKSGMPLVEQPELPLRDAGWCPFRESSDERVRAFGAGPFRIRPSCGVFRGLHAMISCLYLGRARGDGQIKLARLSVLLS